MPSFTSTPVVAARTPVTVQVNPKFAMDPDGDALTLTIASAPTNTAGSAGTDGTNITYKVTSATSGLGVASS